MEWGLCHDVSQDYGFIKRFDIDEWQKRFIRTERCMNKPDGFIGRI